MEKLIEQLVATCASGEVLRGETVERSCSALNIQCSEFYDRFAHHVAQQLVTGKLTFDAADNAINAIWSESTFQLQGLAYDVFIAFDDGEYDRSADPLGTNPIEKYTRPQIVELLRTWPQF